MFFINFFLFIIIVLATTVTEIKDVQYHEAFKIQLLCYSTYSCKIGERSTGLQPRVTILMIIIHSKKVSPKCWRSAGGFRLMKK